VTGLPYLSLSRFSGLPLANHLRPLDEFPGGGAKDFSRPGNIRVESQASKKATIMAQARLDAVLRHVRGFADSGSSSGPSDGELLHAFVAEDDQTAFATIVRRHGPMVFAVGRRVLLDLQDAEDAFQATFLLLARKASSLRKEGSLAGWLHGVVYRMAGHARRATLRRRQHEGRARVMHAAGPEWEVMWREVQEVLHEEIERLPSIYRETFVLCCLENKNAIEVAQTLGVKEGTVGSRLFKARALLRQALAQRGVNLPAVLAAAALTADRIGATVSRSLVTSTVKAAAQIVAGNTLVAGSIPMNVVTLLKGAKKTMFASNPKTIAVLLLALAGSGVGAFLWAGTSPPPTENSALDKATGEKSDPPLAPPMKPSAPVKHEDGQVVATGRVLDPDGKPVGGAAVVFVRKGAGGRATIMVQTIAGPDGRFKLTVGRMDVLRGGVVVASAKGYGPACQWSNALAKDGELLLRLAEDDVPIRGKILDPEGRPLRGVTVRLVAFKAPSGSNLKAFTEALEAKKEPGAHLEERYLSPWIQCEGLGGLPEPTTTDAEGRFTLYGVGRERLARIRVVGPTIATEELHVLTRTSAALEVTKGEDPDYSAHRAYYGVAFEHGTAPTQIVTGIVRDMETKKPLKGVEVRYIWTMDAGGIGAPREGNLPVYAISDDEGRYRLVGLPKSASRHLVTIPPGDTPYLVCQKVVADTPGLEAVTLNFDLKRGVLVEGRVTDKVTGKPVPATVTYFATPDNPHLEGTGFGGTGYHVPRETAEDGAFKAIALPGPGLLAVKAVGSYLPASEAGDKPFEGGVFGIPAAPHNVFSWRENALIRLSPEAKATSIRCDATVDPGKSLRVRLIGPDGKPVKGAMACGLRLKDGFFLEWEPHPLTGDEAVVRNFNPHQQRMVLFKHEQDLLAGKLQVKEGEEGPLTLRLEPAGILTGRVVDADGMPLAGIRGTVYFHDELLAKAGKEEDKTTMLFSNLLTDKDGRFRVELVPGLRYSNVTLNGTGPFDNVNVLSEFTIKAGETKDLANIQHKK
jgi:RNA polymerase sigma factor (sigma-70 family)